MTVYGIDSVGHTSYFLLAAGYTKLRQLRAAIAYLQSTQNIYSSTIFGAPIRAQY